MATVAWILAGLVGFVAGFMLLFRLSILVTALLERVPVAAFVPLGDGVEQPEQTPYAAAMNEEAKRRGYDLQSVRAHAKGGTYRLHAWFWYSADRKTLVTVVAGTMVRVRFRRTTFLTRLDDGTVLLTNDEFGSKDFSGVMQSDSLINADFGELVGRHGERLAKARDSTLPFGNASATDAYESIQRDVMDQLERKGYARVTDAARTTWKHTLRGAFQQTVYGVRSQSAAASNQLDRIDRPRPGD